MQAVDMWGVGLLAYIMLFGINPFDKGERLASSNAILECQYRFPAVCSVSIEAKDFVTQVPDRAPCF